MRCSVPKQSGGVRDLETSAAELRERSANVRGGTGKCGCVVTQLVIQRVVGSSSGRRFRAYDS